ncbi:MAG: helix-turn-helix transcriptional regulator [Epulopiscium sp.]|nr:helix-turn-helix transcriptional regulator [Candidatus Epulonipiscium sp.]
MKYSLKELRARKGVSQEELARLIGITARTVHNYESDIEKLRNTSYKNIENLARALEVEINEIFLG